MEDTRPLGARIVAVATGKTSAGRLAEAGATVVSGVPVARILPGQGVELEGGRFVDCHLHVAARGAQRAVPFEHNLR